ILYLMLKRSFFLTFLAVLSVPVTLLATGRVMRMARSYFAEQQKCLGSVNGYIEEIMTGQKVVKTFCYEDRAKEEFYQRNNALKTAAQLAQGYAGMMMPMSKNINSIFYAFIATIGGLMTIGGSMSVGSLVVFMQLVQNFGRPINELTHQYNALVTALAGTERINYVMSEEPEDAAELVRARDPEIIAEGGLYRLINDHNGHFYWANEKDRREVRGDVRFNDVTFGYTPQKQILNGISLWAKPGQKIAFVGSTGAGKTTIINLLTGFYDINGGSITIDGIDLSRIHRQDLRNAMSVVLQDTHLFTGTIRDNIRYSKLDATDEEVVAAAKLAEADPFIRRLPQGYDTVIEGDGGNLSQGQRQLLNIARAALADSPILILDEATSSVDTRTERHIEKGLDSLMEGRTTFVIAHRLSTVRNSKAILVMEQGQIIERGTHEDLLEMQGRYYQLYTGAIELD
ncbi:MAG: ABC transporter ATP-binding protein, partial [Firmicutes bacterium]|nr:ABC transporter ATP-binding protein [Bacillota bacterium]